MELQRVNPQSMYRSAFQGTVLGAKIGLAAGTYLVYFDLFVKALDSYIESMGKHVIYNSEYFVYLRYPTYKAALTCVVVLAVAGAVMGGVIGIIYASTFPNEKKR